MLSEAKGISRNGISGSAPEVALKVNPSTKVFRVISYWEDGRSVFNVKLRFWYLVYRRVAFAAKLVVIKNLDNIAITHTSVYPPS